MAVALVPDQAIFDNISLVRIGARFMDDRQECVRWCQQYGLLATQMVCPTCRHHCGEQALDHAVAVDSVTWRCPVKACKKRFSIRPFREITFAVMAITWPHLSVVPECWKVKGSVSGRRPA